MKNDNPEGEKKEGLFENFEGVKGGYLG